MTVDQILGLVIIILAFILWLIFMFVDEVPFSMFGKIKNKPKYVYERHSVGAPKGGKFHYFYWTFLENSDLKQKYALYFDWNIYRYMLKKSDGKIVFVIRKGSKSWSVIVTDKKSYSCDIYYFKKVRDIIKFLKEV